MTIIVPWSAGGGTDATARMVAADLQEHFGQPFNVVNRTGGGGLVGHAAIGNAKPDGYTLGVITIESTMYESQGLPGVTPDDFDYIGRYNADAIGINVSTKSDYNSVKDLIDAVKANPGKITASGANRGGLSHLAWAGLLNTLDISPEASNWVASAGSAPAMQQLAAGAIDVVSTSPAEARSLVEAGEVKTLALISGEKSELFLTFQRPTRCSASNGLRCLSVALPDQTACLRKRLISYPLLLRTLPRIRNSETS